MTQTTRQGRAFARAATIYGLLLLSSFGSLKEAVAGPGKLVCKIEERSKTARKTYTIERESKLNHTVYYYSNGELLPHYFIRLHGMVGVGAQYLHLDIEDTTTSHSAFTREVDAGMIRLGTKSEWIEAQCFTAMD